MRWSLVVAVIALKSERCIRSVSGKPGGNKQLLLLRWPIVFYWIKIVHHRREGERGHVAL